MKPIDHGNCDPNECIHAREIMLGPSKSALPETDKETAYYERKRRDRYEHMVSHLEADAKGYAEPREEEPDYVEQRRLRVLRLEGELLEARAEQARYGDPMPLQDVRNVVGDALRLLESKRVYGDAWRAQGYMGNLARLQSKNARLRELLWRDADGNGYPLPANYTKGNGETVVDTALDLINLAAMFVVNFTEENRWGR